MWKYPPGRRMAGQFRQLLESDSLTLSFPGSRGWILRIQEDQQINVSKLFNGQHTTINEISNETLDISF